MDPRLRKRGAENVEGSAMDPRLPKRGAENLKGSAMDPRLPKRGAENLKDIDRHYNNLDPGSFQISIGEFTPLRDAVEINKRMKVGVRGENALQVFNPEIVTRKVEAEQAIQGAVARMDSSIAKVNLKIDKSRTKVKALKELLELGPGNVRVGPSINHRSLEYEQVVFSSEVEVRVDGMQSKRVGYDEKAEEAVAQKRFRVTNCFLEIESEST